MKEDILILTYNLFCLSLLPKPALLCACSNPSALGQRMASTTSADWSSVGSLDMSGLAHLAHKTPGVQAQPWRSDNNTVSKEKRCSICSVTGAKSHPIVSDVILQVLVYLSACTSSARGELWRYILLHFLCLQFSLDRIFMKKFLISSQNWDVSWYFQG